MKKAFLIFVITLASITTHAQLRHVSGIKSIGLGYGHIKNGYQLNASFGHRFNPNFEFKTTLAYESINFEISPASFFYLHPEALYVVKKVTEYFYINVKGGLIIGLEHTSNPVLERTKSGLSIGQNLGISNELYLTNKHTVKLELEQRFFQKSLYGSNSYLLAISLNYKL